MDPVRIGARHAGKLVDAERDRLIHSGHAAINLSPRARAGVQVESSPRVPVSPAPEIARLKFLGPIEPETPLVFSRQVGAGLTAIVKLDVVINASVVNQRSEKRLSIRSGVPLASLDVASSCDEMIHRQCREKLSRKCEWRGRTGFARPGPRRDA